MICTLVSISFDSTPLGHAIKTKGIKLYTVDPEICSNSDF